MQGLIGRKLGMTQIYDDRGVRVPVTIIEVGSCVVLQRKTRARDGYEAVQLGFGNCREGVLNKAELGRIKKAGVTPRQCLREVRPSAGDAELKPGDAVTASIFEGVSHVDVIGITKGRGFAGLLKRHHMGGGAMTHGGHSKRRVGSIGQCSFPARVAKGQRMPGHMGHVRRTQQNLKLVGIRPESNVLLVQGAVPGAGGGIVLVRKALKKTEKAS
jgi:large subunit ribosomal protein L3